MESKHIILKLKKKLLLKILISNQITKGGNNLSRWESVDNRNCTKISSNKLTTTSMSILNCKI